MLISGKYRPVGPWNPGQNAVIEAEEVSSGDRIFLHFLDPGNPDHQLLQQEARKFLDDVPPERRSQPFDLGEHEGTLFLATPALPEFKALDESGLHDWIEWQIKGHELRSRLRQSANRMRDLREQSQTALGQESVQLPPQEVQASDASSSAPSAKQVSPDEIPGDFTNVFQQSGGESPPGPSGQQQASAPPLDPAPPPTSEAGDFTRVFMPQGDGSGSPAGRLEPQQPRIDQTPPEPTKPAGQSPPAPPKQSATPSAHQPEATDKAPPGDFTRIFAPQKEPSPTPIEQEMRPAKAEPPSSAPPEQAGEAGDFTRIFSAGAVSPEADSPPAAPLPKQPATGQPDSSAGPDQQAGDFTRIFRQSLSPVPPPAPQPSAASPLPDEPAAEPQSPPEAPQPGRGPEGAGEFTQMWGGLDSSQASAPPFGDRGSASESRPGSLPWEGRADQSQEPGDFTRIFKGGSAATPSSQPPSAPSDRRQSDEFSRMFGQQQPDAGSAAASDADATQVFEDRSQGLPGLSGSQQSGPSEYTQFMQASSIPVNQAAADEGAPPAPPATQPEADAALEVKKSKDTKPGASLNYLILALVFCALLLLALAAVVFFAPSGPAEDEAGQAQTETSPAEGADAAATPAASGTSPVRPPSVRGPSATGPSVRGPSISGTSVTKPSVRKPTVRKPSMTTPSARLSTPSSRGAAQPAPATGSTSPLLAVILLMVALFLIAAAVVVYFALVKKSG